MYLIIIIIIFIVYDPYAQIAAAQTDLVVDLARTGEDFTQELTKVTQRAAFDTAKLIVNSGAVVQACVVKDVVFRGAEQNLKKRVFDQVIAPAGQVVDDELYKLSQSQQIRQIVEGIEGMRNKVKSLTLGRSPAGPLDPAGRGPLLLLPAPARQEVAENVGGYVASIKEWVGSLSAVKEMKQAVDPCRSYEAKLAMLQEKTTRQLKGAVRGLKSNLSSIRNVGGNVSENVRMGIWRVVILASLLKTLALLRRMILPIRRDDMLEDRRPEFYDEDGNRLMGFRMRKSRKASRKRRSAKRKASRKRRSAKKKSRKRKSTKRKSTKRKATSRKRKSAKRKASRKRKSVKRKGIRKRKSAKRKASRKRKSAKRKVSRKRKAKRKASRKRKSAKRKASRKRKSAKRKVSRKRRSVKRKVSRKASRKRKSAKRKVSRKASRKRKSAKRKASRKKKSAKHPVRHPVNVRDVHQVV